MVQEEVTASGERIDLVAFAELKATMGSLPPCYPPHTPTEPCRKNGGKWRFFQAQIRHFSVLGAGISSHKPLIWPLFCRPTFLAPASRKNVGRHFMGDDFVDVTAEAVFAQTLRIVGPAADTKMTP